MHDDSGDDNDLTELNNDVMLTLCRPMYGRGFTKTLIKYCIFKHITGKARQQLLESDTVVARFPRSQVCPHHDVTDILCVCRTLQRQPIISKSRTTAASCVIHNKSTTPRFANFRRVWHSRSVDKTNKWHNLLYFSNRRRSREKCRPKILRCLTTKRKYNKVIM